LEIVSWKQKVTELLIFKERDEKWLFADAAMPRHYPRRGPQDAVLTSA
jgi:hypothetical protein